MGKIDQTGRGKFTITYGGLESPMSGIDATHQSGLYLNPTSLAAAGGVMSQDGYLNTIFLNPRVSIPLGTNDVYAIGDVQTFYATQIAPYNIIKSSIGFVFVSIGANLNVLEYKQGFLGPLTTGLSLATIGQATNLSYVVINGVVYVTGLGLGAIYAYTPNPVGASTFTLLTNYVGGSYLSELNGRLLCIACDQLVGGTYSYYPYRIAWSAAQGNYSQFNPLVGGLVTGAGYNNLPDVADEITGYFNVGPTGYAIRKQGITEISPLNSGIQPFDFNHLWASNKGIGTIYPNSLTQYGSLGGFLSDTGVFTLGHGGFKDIQGLFWAEINRLIDSLYTLNIPYTTLLGSVVAGLVPLYINNERKLVYILYIPNTQSLLFVGDVETQNWNSVSCYNYGTTVGFGMNTQIKGISYAAIYGAYTGDQTVACVTAIFQTAGGQYNLVIFTLDDTLQLPSYVAPTPFSDSSPFVMFPIEEVVMNRDITIDSIAMIADADTTDSASFITVKPNLSSPNNPPGIDYSTLAFNSQSQYLISYPTPVLGGGLNALQFTDKYPQLTLNITMNQVTASSLRIYKVVLYCSFEPDEAP